MRACLAVLKDSFREALASRVLWILLVLTTLFLALLAPLGIEEQKATLFSFAGIRNWSGLIAKIEKKGQLEDPSPARQVWLRWSPDFKKRLGERDPKPGADFPPDLIFSGRDEINALLPDRAFYDAAAWGDVELTSEARELLERGVDRLEDTEVRRLNRLLIEAAFPSDVSRGQSAELYVKYLGWRLGDALPVSREQAMPFIKLAVGSIVNFFVGTLGILAAILVTASIIPHTFEAGAIDLLLSKPVSRSLLVLTKFLGGCAFILLNAAYFIVGLWLIVGSRFGLWSPRLLLCIPVLMFLFAIYYSVSTLAGVIWRNAIVSVVVTILFWGLCFTVGTSKNVIEGVWLNPERVVRLVPAGPSLFAVNDQSVVRIWDPTANSWVESFVSTDSGDVAARRFRFSELVGPVYDAQQGRLLAVESPPGRGPFQIFGPAQKLGIASLNDGWVRHKGPNPPAGTEVLLVGPKWDVFAVATGGLFRLGHERGEDSPEAFLPAATGMTAHLDSPISASIDAESGAMAIFSRGAVMMLAPGEEGRYTVARQAKLDGVEETMPALVALGGRTLMVGLADGRVLAVDSSELTVRHEFRPERGNAPRAVVAAAGGRWFAVLFHHRRLRVFDAREDRPAEFSIPGQGEISAAAFDGPDNLLVVDRIARVRNYALDPFRFVDQRVPDLSVLERVYYYGVVPIYTIFPKPGELDNVVSYLLTEQESINPNMAGPEQSLTAARARVDVWGPLWSSLAFLAFVLLVTCVYVARSDF